MTTLLRPTARAARSVAAPCRFIAGRRYRHASLPSATLLPSLRRPSTFYPSSPFSHSTKPCKRAPVSSPAGSRTYSATATAVREEEEPSSSAVIEARVVQPESALHEAVLRVRDVLIDEVGVEGAWIERVQTAAGAFESGRAASIAVWGAPEAEPSELVTSLLLEPLAEDEKTRKAIEGRLRESTSGVFVTRYGQRLGRDVNSLGCDSPWLRDAQFELQEVKTQEPEPALTALLTSDFPILVLDPIRLLNTPSIQSILPSLLSKPNFHIIVNGRLPPLPATSAATPAADPQAAILAKLSKQISSNVPVSFVDSTSALRAMASLRKSLSLASTSRDEAFHSFQTLYLASNLGTVSQSLLGDLRSLHPSAFSGKLQLETAAHTASLALSHATAILERIRSEADTVLDQAQSLRQEASTVVGQAMESSFTRHESIGAEMTRTREAVGRVLGQRLSWWKVVGWRVDQVGDEMGSEVQGRWGYGLAQQLSFEAGRLQAVQKAGWDRVDSILTQYAKPRASSGSSSRPFYSAILQNRLEQLESITAISSLSLLPPLDRRRTQLLQSSVPALHKRAHQLTWTMYSLLFLTSSLSWSATVPLGLVSGYTGTGVGLLAGMGIIRWAAGRWKRAERLFWKDWDRVAQGLEEDLKADLTELLDTKVTTKVVMAAEGLESLARTRVQRVDEVEAKVAALKQIIGEARV